jgi:hypothetical protein
MIEMYKRVSGVYDEQLMPAVNTKAGEGEITPAGIAISRQRTTTRPA